MESLFIWELSDYDFMYVLRVNLCYVFLMQCFWVHVSFNYVCMLSLVEFEYSKSSVDCSECDFYLFTVSRISQFLTCFKSFI